MLSLYVCNVEVVVVVAFALLRIVCVTQLCVHLEKNPFEIVGYSNLLINKYTRNIDSQIEHSIRNKIKKIISSLRK